MTTTDPEKQLKDDKWIVKSLCNVEKGLNDWEVRFIESMNMRVLKVKGSETMTEKQRAVATRLYDQHCCRM